MMRVASAAARRCPVCPSTALRHHHPSRQSSSQILACRKCGVHFLAEMPAFEQLVADQDCDAEFYSGYVNLLREGAVHAGHAEALRRLAGLIGGAEGRSLYDVGAGAGGFLASAREAGFRPAGNELSSGAIELAREKYGIDLQLGDLSTLDAGRHDAATLWCVLAHVPDGNRLLADVFDLLKPGGVMFLQTPRWSRMDKAGMLAHRASRGRMTLITDRRLAWHHMTLHTATSVRHALEHQGFEVIAIEPRVRYSLQSESYLGSLKASPRLAARLAKPIDRLLERGLFFRNVLDVYARRPAR